MKKNILHKLWNFFLLLREYISGDFAYKNYLQHCKKNHMQEKALDKKSFLRDKEKNKWNKINRCC
jgi:uncharacterized short protein YbdD (DUF466 family)